MLFPGARSGDFQQLNFEDECRSTGDSRPARGPACYGTGGSARRFGPCQVLS
jgi:hypothetical protein